MNKNIKNLILSLIVGLVIGIITLLLQGILSINLNFFSFITPLLKEYNLLHIANYNKNKQSQKYNVTQFKKINDF